MKVYRKKPSICGFPVVLLITQVTEPPKTTGTFPPPICQSILASGRHAVLNQVRISTVETSVNSSCLMVGCVCALSGQDRKHPTSQCDRALVDLFCFSQLYYSDSDIVRGMSAISLTEERVFFHEAQPGYEFDAQQM